MPHEKSRVLVYTFCIALVTLLALSPCPVNAQDPEDWFGDDNVKIYIALDGRTITDASESSPIVIDPEANTTISLSANITSSLAVYNLSGAIGFFYQSIKVFSLSIRQAEIGYIAPGSILPPVEAVINLGEILSAEYGGFEIELVTGIFQASVDFAYHLQGEDIVADPPHTFSMSFYLTMPPKDILGAIFTVAGIATSVATVGAVVGFGWNIKALIEGLSTASKVRSIQKKAGELRSLPNLTVLGALPALFAVVSGIRIREKSKRKVEEKEESQEGVSEYRVRQRLREVAPDAFPGDKCPKCMGKWNNELKTCKKCKIDIEEARRLYADLLIAKLPRALKVVNKKKSISIKKLSKKTKSNQYNAGVIGAALVDTGLTEITKIETPLRGFVTNIGGLIFLVITWQQLLGGAASQFQTTLTLLGAGLSVAVIIALYFARKTQIQKLQASLDEGKPLMPTATERSVQAGQGGAGQAEAPSEEKTGAAQTAPSTDEEPTGPSEEDEK